MDRMTMIFVIIALLIVGLIIFVAIKGKADAERAKQQQIAALINYKISKDANDAKKKTSWLDTITGVVALASNVIAPGSGAAASAAGGQVGNFIK